MTTDANQSTSSQSSRRAPLTRDRILVAAVRIADERGLDAVSMRNVGHELGYEAMSLYNHVANKNEMLDGMADLVISEVQEAAPGSSWKEAMRNRILSARNVMLRHPWAPGLLESRRAPTPTMMGYMDSMMGIMRDGGFSYDLIHHAMHTLGSRLIGFTQELFDDSDADLGDDPQQAELMMRQMLAPFPNITAMLEEISHDDDSVVGSGCDDNTEFLFALDLVLEGLDRLNSSLSTS